MPGLEPAFEPIVEESKRPTGLLEEPVDHRDYFLDDIVGEPQVAADRLPTTFLLTQLDSKNQGPVPSCTAFATYHSAEATLEFVKQVNVDTDPHKGWELQKKLGTASANGDFISTALKSAVQNGIHSPDGKVYEVDGYAVAAWGGSEIDRIKQRLFEGYGILTSYDIARNTQAGTRAGRLPLPDGPRLTGHAVAIKGWNEEGLIIANSYGPTWGAFRDGTFIVPYAHAHLLKGCYSLFVKPPVNMIFPDVSNLSPHAKSIQKVKDLGIMTGTQEGLFEPSRPVTRRELAIVVDRLIDHLTK